MLARCACDSCYYISYRKPEINDGDADLKLPQQSWLHQQLSTIVTDLRGFQPMENGEGTVPHESRRPPLRNQCN